MRRQSGSRIWSNEGHTKLSHLCIQIGNRRLTYYTEGSWENKKILILGSDKIMPSQMTWRAVLVLSS